MEENKELELKDEKRSVVEAENTDSREEQKSFLQDNRGVGVIEIVLILVVLIGLVLIFKDQITAIVNDAFKSISGDAGKILN